MGQPFDYLPELRALAEKLNMYILMNSSKDDMYETASKPISPTTTINVYGNVSNSDLSTNKNGDFNNNSSETPSDAKEEGRKNRINQIIVAIISALAVVVGAIITAILTNS